MSKLPVISGRDTAKAFGKRVAKGTLRSLIREAGLTVEEFVALL